MLKMVGRKKGLEFYNKDVYRQVLMLGYRAVHNYILKIFLIRLDLSELNLKQCLWIFQSQSSVLTDDEGRDGHSSRSGIEKTIRAVYAQKKVDYFA